ncbi:carcinoembryonic antigen-related cell adhesion molecule 3-like isoform X2 [Pseudonaja textilis]|uniref:carcinoembryonic antigen-related cell adhesion molecule 3-like isoform X2 n=1 Tax=Pseudonaja textilis TaxID=8673 RepID=UPI000EA9E58A|nr:carcinoembryonic antigen-related cell adhesion molecule 3-like isoform X2 [Pseudonaja textilis]
MAQLNREGLSRSGSYRPPFPGGVPPPTPPPLPPPPPGRLPRPFPGGFQSRGKPQPGRPECVAQGCQVCPGASPTPVWALASNFPPSETIHIAQFPPYHTFGKMILLFLDDPRSPPACNWFRGRDQSKKSHIFRGQSDPVSGYYRINQTGPAFTGREDVEKGCSLIIQNVQDSDAGPYTVSMVGLGGKDCVTGVRNLQLSYSPFISHPEATRLVQFPPNPRVGQSVYLYLDDIPNPTDCSWFRGKDRREEGRIFRAKFSRTSHSYLIDQKGAAHRGREEVWRACALVIRKVEASDAGPYTISVGDEWDAYPITAWRELRVST